MTNIEKYNELFIQNFRVRVEQLNSEFIASDIEQWDSLAHLQLITLLEDAFDILIDADEIMEITSYENGKIVLKKYGVEV